MKKLLLLLLALGLALPTFAQTKTLLNLDKAGVAIQGYDPVAFFTDTHGAPTPHPITGEPAHLAITSGKIGSLFHIPTRP
jgi:hypothetical protein